MISWAKGEQSWLMTKLIDEKVDWWKVVWWESSLMKKLIDENIDWWESWLHMVNLWISLLWTGMDGLMDNAGS